jgi:hypothetical protein
LATVTQHPYQARGIEGFKDAIVSRVILQKMLDELSDSSIRWPLIKAYRA